MKILHFVGFTVAMIAAEAAAPPQGGVSGVSVAPATAETGQEVAITVTGTDPCGAVHLVTGDGAAVTHAITGLPSTHAHTYHRPGKYTVVAQGMGNCAGEARTTVEVTGQPLEPEPPPVPRAEFAGIDVAPSPGRPAEPVTFTLAGRGTCEIGIEFGDGNTRVIRGDLPQRVSHAYRAAGHYTVAATATGGCQGRHTRDVQIATPEPAGQLSRLVITPAPATTGEPVQVHVDGSGPCALDLDFGDGNRRSYVGTLPVRVAHVYEAAGRYMVQARGESPCAGHASLPLDVRGR